jgi:hypothetical protein
MKKVKQRIRAVVSSPSFVDRSSIIPKSRVNGPKITGIIRGILVFMVAKVLKSLKYSRMVLEYLGV